MRIETLEVAGWMPFAERFQLTLPKGPIAIVGSYAGDTRRSNRAGKTSLLEAITWCLFGVHRKRLDDAIINRECEECEVTVELGELRVKRSRERGKSTKLLVRVDTTTCTGAAAQQAIDEHIGLGLDDYLATNCFRQGDVESLIMRTSGERLAIVSEWLQQSRWLDAKKIQSAKVSAVDAQLAQTRGALGAAQVYVLSDAMCQALRDELQRVRVRLEELRNEQRELGVTLELQADVARQVQLHAELEELRVQATELREQLVGRADAVRRKSEASGIKFAAELRHEQARAKSDELVQIQRTGFDGTCPVMCEQCPAAEAVTEHMRVARRLSTDRERELVTARAQWHSASAELMAAEAQTAAFERLAARYSEAVSRGRTIAAQLKSKQAPAVEVDAAAVQAQLETSRSTSAQLAERAGEIESMLVNAAKHEERYKLLVNQVEQVEVAANVSRLAYRAISAVPSRIAADQLGELEEEANQLLAGTGVSVRFSWARELADKAPICEECGYVYASKRHDVCPTCKSARGKKLAQELELLCNDGSGVEEDARFNSGGTRAVVGSAIRLAASAMLRRLRSSRAAWAIVDEPFGSLDAENREQLARTFAGMLGSVGLEQALVVSHDPLLLSALPHRLVIDRDGANSTVRLE